MSLRLSFFPIRVKLLLVLSVIAAAVYANTLKNDFAFDDYIVIKYNAVVAKGVSAIPEIFSTGYFNGTMNNTGGYYRPLSLAMFAVENQLFNGSPVAGHCINVLVFIAGVLFLFLFLDDLFEGKKTVASFIACVLFALHPVHTEVVANIKSRDELLCFLLAFWAMNRLLFFADSGKPRELISGLALFFLSLLSKETAITFLAVFPLVFFFYKNENRRRSWYIVGGSLAVAVLFLAIRYLALAQNHPLAPGSYSFLDNPLIYAPDAGARVATAVQVLGYYLKLLFIPYPLISDHSYNTIPFTSFMDMRVLLSLVAYGLMIGVGLYRLASKRKDPYAFGILFYLTSISLFANLFLPIGTIMGERFLFFPAAGFCLCAGLLLENAMGIAPGKETLLLNDKRLGAVILLLCGLYGADTVVRNTEWRDNYTLFKADVRKAPENCRLWYNLGTDRIIAAAMENTDTARLKLLQEGLEDLKSAIAIYPQFDLAWSESGNVFFKEGWYDSAEVYYNRAVALNPRDATAINDLAAIFFKTKRYGNAVAFCKKSVALDPAYAPGYRNMGNGYLMMGAYDSAARAYKQAIMIDPGTNVSYERLAIAYKYAGELDSAKKYLLLARVKNPEFNY